MIKVKYHTSQFFLLLTTALILIGNPIVAQIMDVESDSIIQMLEAAEEEERTEDTENKSDSYDSILSFLNGTKSTLEGSGMHISRVHDFSTRQLEVITPPPESLN